MPMLVNLQNLEKSSDKEYNVVTPHMRGLHMVRRQTAARLQPPRGYITAKEAKKRLGIRGIPISDGMLRSYVQKGEIERRVPANRVQGYYKEEDVDRIAQGLKAFYGEGSPAEIQFLQTTAEDDVAETIRIDNEVYGSPGTPLETRLAWLRKNPELLYVLKSDQVVGYASVLPLRREKIDAILREEAHLKDLTTDDIELFEPGNPLDIYIYSVAVRPAIADREERHALAAQLISGLMNKLLEWAQRGVVLRSFLARSRFPDGIRLLKRMGFSEYPVESPDKRFAYFILEVDQSNALFIRRYRRALGKAQGEEANGKH